MEASAKDGVGAGRGPCGLRNSELGPRPHDLFIAIKIIGGEPKLRPDSNVCSACQNFFVDEVQCVCREK